jgi:hypothetical protein
MDHILKKHKIVLNQILEDFQRSADPTILPWKILNINNYSELNSLDQLMLSLRDFFGDIDNIYS